MSADPLAELPGIGPTTAGWLRAVGVHDYDDLEELGSVEVYRRLRAAPEFGHLVTRNALWALEGALLGCDWRDLPERRKGELLAQLRD